MVDDKTSALKSIHDELHSELTKDDVLLKFRNDVAIERALEAAYDACEKVHAADERRVYVNDRGHLLSHWGPPQPHPLIVVELYMKWYTLFIINPDGSVEALCYPDFEEAPNLPKGISCYHDHVPNPVAVQAYADWKEMEICSEALELMIGRWVTDVKGIHPDPEDKDPLYL